MGRHKPKRYISLAEYLAGEHNSAVRREYVQGEVYPVAGASDSHNRIAGNIYARLFTHLGGGPCEPFIYDMKIKVGPEVFYYPDVVVACDPAGDEDYFRTEPRLIIEVISPSTERIDRHEKMAAYKSMPSLQEYVLAMEDEMRVERHRRKGTEWEARIYTDEEEQVRLASVRLSLSLAEIYSNVRLPDTDEG